MTAGFATPLKQIKIQLITYDKEISYFSFREIVKSQAFECFYERKRTIFTYNNVKQDHNNIKYSNEQSIIFLSKTDFTQLLIELYGNFITNFCLNTRRNTKSVKYFNFKKFKIACLLLSILTLIIALLYRHSYFLYLFVIFLKNAIILYYIVCIFIKSYLLIRYFIVCGNNCDKPSECAEETCLMQTKLPKYTILVPMFHENEATIKQSVKSIEKLKYPKDLLDVKFVLEADDIQTSSIFQNIKLPEYITIIFVPYFEPRTKPKACNFASLFATGEILVIFDAEDIPNDNQLLVATKQFNENKNITILQGCLSFYNYNYNLITECFNIEYLIWFKQILASLSKSNITFPLGGTSNHIRYSFLEKQYWDSYNVTEDLELSVIVDKNNIQIQHLNSDTKEWCVLTFKSFIKQRTRWIKGYLLTYFTHFFDYCHYKQSIQKTIFFHVFIGYSALSFLLFPILLLSLILTKENCLLTLIFSINSIIYYFSYIISYYLVCKNCNIVLTKKTIIAGIIYPFYFMLHTFSAYKAFYEIFSKPFYWSKTKHLL